MDSVTILGARGSVPRDGAEFVKYGGETTCVLVRMAGETIILDAGTGLMRVPVPDDPFQKHAVLLLTHAHADHLLGLPLCPLLLDPGFHLDIYARSRNGLDTEAQIDAFMSPPLWPVRIRQLPADVVMREMPAVFQVGGVTVETAEGCHPGGVTLLRLSAGSSSVVFMTDCTLTDELLPSLTDFAQGCSLLLCDGQYTDAEWETRSGFGHSSWSQVLQFALRCGAQKLRIIHHDPSHSDSFLDAAATGLSARHPDCRFAQANEVIAL